jgi:hypothetical protein
MSVPGGTGSLARISTLAKLQRRTHNVCPSDGKARLGFRNEYMYNVMQCRVAYCYALSYQQHMLPPTNTNQLSLFATSL